MPAANTIESFWKRVEKTDTCWWWKSHMDTKGYGRFFYHCICYSAHRFAYLTSVGDIPDGLELDHLCNNKTCVRPDHLKPTTHRENIVRAFVVRGPTLVCKRGHRDRIPVYDKRYGRTHTICGTCLKATRRRSKARRQAKRLVSSRVKPE